jgi:hypothetical protein
MRGEPRWDNSEFSNALNDQDFNDAGITIAAPLDSVGQYVTISSSMVAGPDFELAAKMSEMMVKNHAVLRSTKRSASSRKRRDGRDGKDLKKSDWWKTKKQEEYE